MAIKLKSHTTQKLLIFGESLRENPKTVLLSIPMFALGLLYYFLIGNKEGIAGSLGHMGIAFTNYYKHYWQKRFLLKIGYFLFDKSSKFASGEGKVSTILHCGQAAQLLEDYTLAERKSLEALKEVDNEKVKTGIEGYIYGHYLGTVEIKKDNLDEARKYIDKGLKILDRKLKESPNSLYLQIWLSGVELTMGEYWLARGDKEAAGIWGKKVERRAAKYNLNVRKLDAKKLLSQIGRSFVTFIFALLSSPSFHK